MFSRFGKIKRMVKSILAEYEDIGATVQNRYVSPKGLYAKPTHENALIVPLSKGTSQDIIFALQDEVDLNDGDVVLTDDKSTIHLHFDGNMIEANTGTFKVNADTFEFNATDYTVNTTNYTVNSTGYNVNASAISIIGAVSALMNAPTINMLTATAFNVISTLAATITAATITETATGAVAVSGVTIQQTASGQMDLNGTPVNINGVPQ